MLIDFRAMEETVIPAFKGGEGDTIARMYADDTVRILHGRLEPGCSIGLHTHEGSSETVYILSGNGTMLCDGVEEPLSPGVASYCADGHNHSLINTGSEPLVFFAVVPQLGK